MATHLRHQEQIQFVSTHSCAHYIFAFSIAVPTSEMRIQYQLVSPASMETQLANAWNIGHIEPHKQKERVIMCRDKIEGEITTDEKMQYTG